MCRKVQGGDWLLLYETAPTSAAIGLARITGVISGTPQTIWTSLEDEMGMTREQFMDAFRHRCLVHALSVWEPRRFSRPMPLARLRTLYHGFNPQAYTYWVGEPLHHLIFEAFCGDVNDGTDYTD